MTDQQLYLAVGLPIVAILTGLLINGIWWMQTNNRIGRVETRLDARFDRLDARFDRLEAALVGKMDILTGKVIEIDNRLTRVEEQLKHLR